MRGEVSWVFEQLTQTHDTKLGGENTLYELFWCECHAGRGEPAE